MVPENTLPEVETRKVIEQKLVAAGWVIQDKGSICTPFLPNIRNSCSLTLFFINSD